MWNEWMLLPLVLLVVFLGLNILSRAKTQPAAEPSDFAPILKGATGGTSDDAAAALPAHTAYWSHYCFGHVRRVCALYVVDRGTEHPAASGQSLRLVQFLVLAQRRNSLS